MRIGEHDSPPGREVPGEEPDERSEGRSIIEHLRCQYQIEAAPEILPREVDLTQGRRAAPVAFRARSGKRECVRVTIKKRHPSSPECRHNSHEAESTAKVEDGPPRALMAAIEMAGQLDRARPEVGPVRRLDRIDASQHRFAVNERLQIGNTQELDMMLSHPDDTAGDLVAARP
jgi:hypothetical protein